MTTLIQHSISTNLESLNMGDNFYLPNNSFNILYISNFIGISAEEIKNFLNIISNEISIKQIISLEKFINKNTSFYYNYLKLINCDYEIDYNNMKSWDFAYCLYKYFYL